MVYAGAQNHGRVLRGQYIPRVRVEDGFNLLPNLLCPSGFLLYARLQQLSGYFRSLVFNQM